MCGSGTSSDPRTRRQAWGPGLLSGVWEGQRWLLAPVCLPDCPPRMSGPQDLCGGSGLALTSGPWPTAARLYWDRVRGTPTGVPDSTSDGTAAQKPSSGQAPHACRAWAGGRGPQGPCSSSWRGALKGTQRWGPVGVLSTPSAGPLGRDRTRGLAFLLEGRPGPSERA